jgi:hypothetical protein
MVTLKLERATYMLVLQYLAQHVDPDTIEWVLGFFHD